MLRMPIDVLQPGMILAKSVIDDQGNILLRQGVHLTADYIDTLARRGVLGVYISDGDTDDIDMEDMLSDEVRRKTQLTLTRIFSFVQEISANLTNLNTDAVVAAIKDPGVVNALRDHKGFNQLETSVTSILGEIIGADMLMNISQIRSHNDTIFTHSINVTVAALMIGKRLHLNQNDLKRLGSGCMLHDIGKIFVNNDLLRPQNNRPLSPEQQRLLRDHPRLGYELLRFRNPDAVMTNHVALEHHERQDGLGYPRGLHGTNRLNRLNSDNRNILLIAEIAAVADVFDMLSINRPGCRALTPRQIAETMRRLAGNVLNRELVELFLSMIPVLPPGIHIVVRAGRYTDYRGVVVRVENQDKPDRPLVRLLYNPQGERIVPVNLNLARESAVEVEAMLYV